MTPPAPTPRRRAGFSTSLTAEEAALAKTEALKRRAYALAVADAINVPVNETEWMLRAVVREQPDGSVHCTLEV